LLLKKLLVIENDMDTLEIVGILLENNDFEVVKSAQKKSIKEIIEINPDIVVIDYLLGDGRGNELCLEIKTNPLTKQIPVILFSASPNLEKVIENCLADAYIAKPFDLDDFLEMVNQWAYK
jgi:DNA-binding response OmpR family regulator